MRTTVSVGRIVSVTVTLLVLASAWFFLAPPLLGGRTSYVTTDGISMLPRFHTGDLAIVRARSSYRVGEIVAYHSRALHTVVLHRIVAREGNRFVFKGDNNDFLDPERPKQSQLVGALWLHVPHAVEYMAPLRSPVSIGALVGLGVLLALLDTRRRRRRSDDGRRPVPAERPPPPSARASPEVWLVAGAAPLLLCAALAVFAYTRPTTVTASHKLAYQQAGSFAYSGVAPRSVAYPTGRIATREPVFLKLVKELRVRFDYSVSSEAANRLAGTISLAAVIENSAGWKRTISLAGKHAFTGDRASTSGTLDVASLPSLLAQLESATAVQGMTYTLTLVPHVHLAGEVGGTPVTTSFKPSLPFSLDALQLRPTDDTPAAAASDPYGPTASGSVSATSTRAATISFGKRGIAVASLRRAAVTGCAAILSILLVLASALVRYSRRRDEPSRIQARYGAWIVSVSHVARGSEGEVVEVDDVATLVKLAERYDRLILHEENEHGHEYELADGGIRYLYRVGEPPPAPHVPPTLVALEPPRPDGDRAVA